MKVLKIVGIVLGSIVGFFVLMIIGLTSCTMIITAPMVAGDSARIERQQAAEQQQAAVELEAAEYKEQFLIKKAELDQALEEAGFPINTNAESFSSYSKTYGGAKECAERINIYKARKTNEYDPIPTLDDGFVQKCVAEAQTTLAKNEEDKRKKEEAEAQYGPELEAAIAQYWSNYDNFRQTETNYLLGRMGTQEYLDWKVEYQSIQAQNVKYIESLCDKMGRWPDTTGIPELQ